MEVEGRKVRMKGRKNVILGINKESAKVCKIKSEYVTS